VGVTQKVGGDGLRSAIVLGAVSETEGCDRASEADGGSVFGGI
jgi:hypothetical protein